MNELDMLREQIDELDKIIATAYAKRLETANKIGEYKKNNNVAVLDQDREKKVLNNVAKFGEKYEKEVKDLYTFIMDYSKNIQRKK